MGRDLRVARLNLMSDVLRPVAEFGSTMAHSLVARYLESKSPATRVLAQPTEMGPRPRTEETLATNLRFLLKLKGWTESELARQSGVAQKTINNILHKVYRAKIETADQLAKPFNLEGWHLIHPSLINDIHAGGTISRLIEAYLHSAEEGQRIILGIAEREAQRKSK